MDFWYLILTHADNVNYATWTLLLAVEFIVWRAARQDYDDVVSLFAGGKQRHWKGIRCLNLKGGNNNWWPKENNTNDFN